MNICLKSPRGNLAKWVYSLFRAACVGLSVAAIAACSSSADSGFARAYDPGQTNDPGSGSNVNLGGSQDVGFFRDQLEAGQVPSLSSLDAAGFFAEHHTELPAPDCGNRICLQPMLGVMSNLFDGANCTMLGIALNSPLAADPAARPPLSLAVVIDVSGSMQGQKIDYVRSGLGMLIDGMRDSDRLTLVTYSDDARVLVPMTDVALRRVELRQAADSLVAEGATNLYAGLEAGYRQIISNYDSGRQNRLILLSDGQPTAGITDSGSIIEMSRGYNSDGIGLTSIGLGADFNIELMRGLALQADGNFYFLENAGAVEEVFTEELSYFTVPIAYDLNLSVTAGSNYSFGRALGSPFWVNTANGGNLEVPSVFIAHRESDTDVTDSGGRRGGGSALLLELMPNASAGSEIGPTVATLNLTFREPGTNLIVEDSVTVTYPYAASELRREGYFDGDSIAVTQKNFVMLNIYVGMEMAIRAFHEGRAGEFTISALDNLIAAVEDYNAEVQDTDIALDLVMLRQLRANLIAQGIFDPQMPVAPDAWPAD